MLMITMVQLQQYKVQFTVCVFYTAEEEEEAEIIVRESIVNCYKDMSSNMIGDSAKKCHQSAL